jgi:hypothetical protein
MEQLIFLAASIQAKFIVTSEFDDVSNRSTDQTFPVFMQRNRRNIGILRMSMAVLTLLVSLASLD